MTISSRRPISEVLHFTTNRGLVGSFAVRNLMSRRRLPQDAYLSHIVHHNSVVRPEERPFFDKSEDWLDYVNLSLTEINSSFFRFSAGWDHNAELWWAIMAFDPAILDDTGVYFATTNNSYEHCERRRGMEGFDALFGDVIKRKGTWKALRGNRHDTLPTCEQAEVLYPGLVSLTALRKVYVGRIEDHDRVRGWLKEFRFEGVDVVIAPNKFRGLAN